MVVQSSIQHKRRTYSSKEHCLEAVHDELTVGICGITEPEETGVVSITLMKVDMEKGFLNVGGNGIAVCTKTKDD